MRLAFGLLATLALTCSAAKPELSMDATSQAKPKFDKLNQAQETFLAFWEIERVIVKAGIEETIKLPIEISDYPPIFTDDYLAALCSVDIVMSGTVISKVYIVFARIDDTRWKTIWLGYRSVLKQFDPEIKDVR